MTDADLASQIEAMLIASRAHGPSEEWDTLLPLALEILASQSTAFVVITCREGGGGKTSTMITGENLNSSALQREARLWIDAEAEAV